MEQIIFLVVVVVAALGKWFFENSGKFGGGDVPDNTPDEWPAPPPRRSPPSNPSGSSNPPGNPARAESEEERMRRFMEALGLPSNAPMPTQRKPAANPPQPAAPAPRAPVPQRRPDPRHLGEPFKPYGGGTSLPSPLQRRKIAVEPRPAPVPQPEPSPSQAPSMVPSLAPAPLPAVVSVSEVAPSMEVASLGRAVEAAASGVESAARITPLKGAEAGTQSEMAAGLKEQLRDPAALKRAILLREILGTPKGLQSWASPSILSLP